MQTEEQNFSPKRAPWVREVIRLRGDGRKLRGSLENLIHAAENGDEFAILQAAKKARRVLLETRD